MPESPVSSHVVMPTPAAEVPVGQVEELSLKVSVPVGMPNAVFTVTGQLYSQKFTDPSYGVDPSVSST